MSYSQLAIYSSNHAPTMMQPRPKGITMARASSPHKVSFKMFSPTAVYFTTTDGRIGVSR